VPSGIVGEVLDRVKREPGYLGDQGMRVLDRSGRVVDPSEIDFSRYTSASFPYVFRQDPGPANALGRIKLMFPNEHSVYLHDTPARALFEREERLFSHGCIRVQDPLGLAELVLGDPDRWNRETLQAAIDAGGTQTLPLARPLPVFVLYWTAAVDLHGELHFYRDVYDRDAAILGVLDSGRAAGTSGGEGR
jgi:murein L,D-transpeptidase YcbB/YkuD